jgi:hypothetical protein
MGKECKNHKKKTYTGKENTPLGRGYHAEGEKIDKKMKGKNGHMYKVIKTKSGKRWLKIIKKLSSPKKRTSRGGMMFPDPENLPLEKLDAGLDSLKEKIDAGDQVEKNKVNYALFSIVLESRKKLNDGQHPDWFMHKMKEDGDIDKLTMFNVVHHDKVDELYQAALNGKIMEYIKTL